MATARTYVPSLALLRALSRPQSLRCPFAVQIPARAQNAQRQKSSKAGKPYKPQKNANPRILKQEAKPVTSDKSRDPKLVDAESKIQQMNDHLKSPQYEEDIEARIAEAEKPLADEDIARGRFQKINFYEQDIDQSRPPRLVERVETAEDARRVRDKFEQIKYHVENRNNPDYDPAPMRQQLLDELIAKPEFADLTDMLMELKQTIRTKEEEAADRDEAMELAEQEGEKLNQRYRQVYYDTFQDLVNDPNIGEARDDIQKLLDQVMVVEDVEIPEFQELFQRAMMKVGDNEAIQQRYGELLEGKDVQQLEQDWAEQEQDVLETLNEFDKKDPAPSVTNIYDSDGLIHQMQDVLQDLGGDPDLELELEEMLSEEEADDGDLESRELNPQELVMELQKLTEKEDIKRQLKLDLRTQKEGEGDMPDMPADVQAKVDKIMADPKLMEKLMYIKSIIEKSESKKADITMIAHEVAPDPYALPASQTTTLQDRMDLVRSDPEHMEAISCLHVKLNPPFNIAPSLKAFNQAIEMAYIGANDDIRRVLWRTYQKARTLPTFMQNMSNDAWDIMYYSQAVTWGSNQNRQDHLRVLIADLRSLGRDGPPTHPSTLIKNGDGDATEV